MLSLREGTYQVAAGNSALTKVSVTGGQRKSLTVALKEDAQPSPPSPP